MNLPKSLVSTIMHGIELVVVLAVAYGVSALFPEHRDAALLIGGTALGTFAKFLRASDAPVSDYVNGEQQ